MKQFEPDEYKAHHIPYKIHAVLLGWRALRCLQVYRDDLPTRVNLGPAVLLEAPSVRIFTNAAVEHGVMAARALIGFLGIKRKPSSGEWDGGSEPRFDSDVTILRFGGKLITKAHVEALDWWNQTRDLDLCDLLEAADLGCAHLTHGASPKAVRSILGGLEIALRLFDHFFWSLQTVPSLGNPYSWVEIDPERAREDGLVNRAPADWTGVCPIDEKHRVIGVSRVGGPPSSIRCQDCNAQIGWRLADYFNDWSIRKFVDV